jgi:hypothetical protein
MRVRLFPVAVLMAAATSMLQPLFAQQSYEGFKLTFPAYNSGAGLSGAWALGGFNAFAAGYTSAEDSLSFAGLVTSGGRVEAEAFNAINGARRNLAQPMGADNTTRYMSVLLRPQGTLHGGVFNGFFGITLAGGPANELFVGKPGGLATGEYVLEHRGGSGQVTSGVATVVGETALLVVRMEFLAGNDIFTLYVNPKPGDPEPASGAVKSDLDLGVADVIGIYSTGAFAVDEIRLGDTYAEVTPASSSSGFAGTPGAANCHGKSVSALAQQHGGMAAAASTLGFDSVKALQQAITAFCAGN